MGTVSPRVLTAWWDRRSDPARIELYTRWTFHFFFVCEAFGFAPTAVLAASVLWAKGVLAGTVVVHAVLGAVATSRALDWALGRRDRPTGLLATQGVLAVLVGTASMVLHGIGRQPDFGVAMTLCGGLLAFAATPLVINLRRARQVLWLVCGATALAAGLALAVTGALRGLVAAAVFTLLLTGAMAFTGRFSAWLLGAVLELDAARETQARLAVAEERLRFGRDLHDVLGRNLSVIALKSELAAQLAQRGSAAAVEQMAEVQRIARESQREMRDVVRGYREAGLDAELAGARGVLEAAGISCRIDTGREARLPQPVQSALAWVVREGTTNVLRHADAAQCTITLRAGTGRTVLTMENDGVRHRPQARTTGVGTGLPGLRERLGPLHGTLTAGSVADGRFRLTAELPTHDTAWDDEGCR
ncbi:sensor histidine kinase [Streptomyces sp. GSL17-111]|uniref:sensor histidine kinase n=1 Tax=Streptomyces sp. GSL17-111 TaxID=3121596 RepID=UPI0030F46529